MLIKTIDDVLRPYRHYPKVIQEAVLMVETHPTFSILTKSSKIVLQQLLTRASQTNGEAVIKARLDVVADSAKVHYKTVQRAMNVLKKIGWISPASEGRSAYGVFESYRYQFSQQLCELVGLPHKGNNFTRETTLSDGAIYVDLTFKKDQRKIVEQDKKSKPITLPSKLLEIVEQGEVAASGVCKLRGLAIIAGHRLEDIWTVAKDRVKALGVTGNRLYRYIAKMISQCSDYAGRASQIYRIEEETKSQLKIADRARKYRYKQFSGAAGLTVKIFEGMAELMTSDGHFRNVSGKAMEEIYGDIENGTLKEIDQHKKNANLSLKNPGTTNVDAKSKALYQNEAKLDQAMQESIAQLPRGPEGNLSLLRSMLNIRRVERTR